MYKWAVYLNNKCSKKNQRLWSVVGKTEKKERKSQTSAIKALTNWKRCPSSNPDDDDRHKIICVSILIGSSVIRDLSNSVSFSVPLVRQQQRLNFQLKRLDPKRLLYPSTVQAQGLTGSGQSCKPVVNHANCLQKAKSSVSSVGSKQFTWWRKSNDSG